MGKYLRFIICTCIWLLLFCLSVSAFSADKVTLQLIWKNQFQFAGYYVAKELGFYEDTGLDVSLRRYDRFQKPKRVVVFDCDSTIIQGEVIDELAEVAGVGADVEGEVARAEKRPVVAAEREGPPGLAVVDRERAGEAKAAREPARVRIQNVEVDAAVDPRSATVPAVPLQAVMPRLVGAIREGPHQAAAHVAAGAGDENSHGSILSKGRQEFVFSSTMSLWRRLPGI